MAQDKTAIQCQITATDRPTDATDRHIDATDRQIGATDGQIDRLVYELHELTDAEIAIVEERSASTLDAWNGRIHQDTGPNGVVTRYEYDPWSRQSKTSRTMISTSGLL